MKSYKVDGNEISKNNHMPVSSISKNISIRPFPHAVIDNFFAEDVFDGALNYWKSSKKISNVDWSGESDTMGHGKDRYLTYGGGRDFISVQKIKNLLNESGDWRKIIDFFSSQELADEIHDSLSKKGYRLKKFKLRSSDYKENIFSALFNNNIYVNFKLSRYPARAGISLHRDLHDKVLAFLFYLGFSDGKKRNLGGTQFYERVSNLHLNEYEVDHYVSNISDFKVINDVLPLPNRLAFFVRTDNSWHGVKTLESNDLDDVTRDNLQINYMKCKPTFFLKITMTIFKLVGSVRDYIYDSLITIQFVVCEGVYMGDIVFHEAKKNVQEIKKWNLIRKIIPKSIFQIIHKIYLFIFGKNILLSRRRRLIRRTILKYCTPPRKGIMHIANYAVDINKLNNLKVALCFGIYDDIRFESLLSRALGLKVLAADPTPVAIKTLKKQDSDCKINFIPKALSLSAGVKNFYFDSNASSVEKFEGSLQNISGSTKFIEVQCDTLEGFKSVMSVKRGSEFILKMDIEGGALEILETMLQDGVVENMPVQIMVEFELNKDEYDVENHRICGLLSSIKKYYDIFYIPRMTRYTNYDFLFVLK